MQVWEVCGAMQASTDTEKWLASHLEGKQHLGYYRVRQTAEQLQKKKEDERGARQREHAAAEKPVEAETKSKIDKVITERTKESDKNGDRPIEKGWEWDGHWEHSGSKERSRSPDHSHDHEAERERERKRDKKRDWGDNDREKDRYCDHDRSQVRAQDRERQIATKCLEDQPGAMTENGTRGNRC